MYHNKPVSRGNRTTWHNITPRLHSPLPLSTPILLRLPFPLPLFVVIALFSAFLKSSMWYIASVLPLSCNWGVVGRAFTQFHTHIFPTEDSYHSTLSHPSNQQRFLYRCPELRRCHVMSRRMQAFRAIRTALLGIKVEM